MVLFFENSIGERRVIGTPDSFENAVKEIREFLEERTYKPYYMRTWREDPCEICFDVGSHSEFFYLYNEDGWSDSAAEWC